jgi:multidrug transporter EmrE-like cation transporter
MAAVIFIFFYLPPEDTPLAAFYGICAGGTVLTIIVGWLLYVQAKAREKAPA